MRKKTLVKKRKREARRSAAENKERLRLIKIRLAIKKEMLPEEWKQLDALYSYAYRSFIHGRRAKGFNTSQRDINVVVESIMRGLGMLETEDERIARMRAQMLTDAAEEYELIIGIATANRKVGAYG